MIDKLGLRKSIKATLAALSIERRQEASLKLSLNLKGVLENFDFAPRDTIGVFAPMKSEPQWQCALQDFEKYFAFPRFVSEHCMEFHQSTFAELVESREFGVTIKVPPRQTLVFPKVLLVPGLAFTERGGRLGRGGGYYDQYLSNHEVVKIGVCLKEQIVPSLPEEEHDQRMTYVVYDGGIIKIAESSKG